MTREEHLEFCKTCQNRKFDLQRGIICSLTNGIANFEGTCENYLIEEKIKALERYKKEHKDKKKKKEETKKHKNSFPERITDNDLYLLLGTTLSATFIFELFVYAEFSYRNVNISIHLLLLIFISSCVSLLLRKKRLKRYTIFSDLKFKIIFSILITVLNVLYNLLVYNQTSQIVYLFISILFISFILSLLSVIIVFPINMLFQKIGKNKNE